MFYINRNVEIERVSISRLYQMYKQDEIDDAPYYQRYSQLWSIEKKRLLIDTIINGYDMPKFYFHYILSSSNKLNSTSKQYAVIDGKQRINALMEFINGDFELDESVKYLDSPNLSFKGITYKSLSNKNDYWHIKDVIDKFQLDIVHITTDDLDRIEEMFLRLNEGVPVNNAEKRNSLGGFLIELANRLVTDFDFFTKKVRFGNKRMEHQDLVLKLCLIENSQKLDSFTKKNLDNLVKHFKPKKGAKPDEKTKLFYEAKHLIGQVSDRLEFLSSCFNNNDEMLRSKGIIPLYYLYTKKHQKISASKFRDFVCNFDKERKSNRKIGKLQKPNTTLIQFDRLNQQGAHQAKSLEIRLRIMEFYFEKGTNNFNDEMPLKDLGLESSEETF